MRSLLEKGPHTFEALYAKIGVQYKKAIRSTVDKKRVAGQFGYDGAQYFIATKKPVAKKPPAKSSKSKKPTKASATVAPMIVHAEPELVVAAKDETPIATEPTPAVSPLMKPTPAVLIRRN